MLQNRSKVGDFMQQPSKTEPLAQASSTGGIIINILEVCESDFATNIAEEGANEANAQAEYEVTKATTENDLSSLGTQSWRQDSATTREVTGSPAPAPTVEAESTEAIEVGTLQSEGKNEEPTHAEDRKGQPLKEWFKDRKVERMFEDEGCNKGEGEHAAEKGRIR